MMDYQKLDIKLKQSPAIRMLRMRNATLAISFLHKQFKEQNEINIRNDQLVQRLTNFLDDLDYIDEEEAGNPIADNFDRAKKFIESWTNESFLRNYIDDSEKVVYNVLTQHTERVFQMLDLLKEREFVGTESKFKDIFYKLRELVDNNTEDPKIKIAELERQKKKIDEEIRRIKREGTVRRYEDYQIKSRFEEVSRLTNELIGDFKEVEDIFKDITRGIYEKQEHKDLSKGQILHYTFDSLDELKESDQGKSFYTFWNFLLDDVSQEELRLLIDNVYRILEERGIETGNIFLRRIKTILHNSGRKVLESNNLMAEKLSRVIAERDVTERRKMRETIMDIRKLALQTIDNPLPDSEGLVIETNASIRMPMERRLGEEKVIPEFDLRPEAFDSEVDLESMARLFNPNQVNCAELQTNIYRMLAESGQATLGEVIRQYPITKGLGEAVGYISLINRQAHYVINEAESEYLLFDAEEQKYLKVPQIIFSK
ncbi:MAG: DUF3375 domain-containing protein [Tannerellaceae bacterium]